MNITSPIDNNVAPPPMLTAFPSLDSIHEMLLLRSESSSCTVSKYQANPNNDDDSESAVVPPPPPLVLSGDVCEPLLWKKRGNHTRTPERHPNSRCRQPHQQADEDRLERRKRKRTCSDHRDRMSICHPPPPCTSSSSDVLLDACIHSVDEAPRDVWTTLDEINEDHIHQHDDAPAGCQPTENDVLMGRGGRSGNHPGNHRYLAWKDALQEHYLADGTDRRTKTALVRELMDRVRATGGRFLQFHTDGAWHEVTDEGVIRKKCRQALREVNTAAVRAAKRARYGK